MTTPPVPPRMTPDTDPVGATPRMDVTCHTAVLSLGSNLGNRLETLQGALDAIADTPGVEVQAVSPVYETEPVGGVEQQSFFNAVVVISTYLTAPSLLERAHAIEEAYKRVREVRWGPRTIDVDIIVYEGVEQDDPHLTLPHPRAHERAFVLVPWHAVAPDAQLPGRGAVTDLLAATGTEGVVLRDDLGLGLH